MGGGGRPRLGRAPNDPAPLSATAGSIKAGPLPHHTTGARLPGSCVICVLVEAFEGPRAPGFPSACTAGPCIGDAGVPVLGCAPPRPPVLPHAVLPHRPNPDRTTSPSVRMRLRSGAGASYSAPIISTGWTAARPLTVVPTPNHGAPFPERETAGTFGCTASVIALKGSEPFWAVGWTLEIEAPRPNTSKRCAVQSSEQTHPLDDVAHFLRHHSSAYVGPRESLEGGVLPPPPPNTSALNPKRHSHTPAPAPTAFPTASNRRRPPPPPPTAFASPVTALQPLWNCPDRPPPLQGKPWSQRREGPGSLNTLMAFSVWHL